MKNCQLPGNAYFAAMKAYAKSQKQPLSAGFELTPFCNFRCSMCYVRLSPEEAARQGKLLPADQWICIAEQAKAMGTLDLTLTGGEPLLHPEFWTIYEALNKMGFLIHILSNGSLIDEAVMAKFAEYGMPYSMKLTLYGASDETYARVCGVSDGFTKAVNGIRLLKQAGVPVKLTSTIVRENACDLQEIYQVARELGVPMQHTISVVKSARGAENTVEASRFALDDFPEELTLAQLEQSKFPPLASPFAWCASYETSFWMTWNGRMQLCAFMNTPAIPWSGDLSADWKRLLEQLAALQSPAECGDCRWSPFCQRCPGVLCAESGHPEHVHDSLCNMAKRLCQLYEKN